jgi:hypothetical protein
LGASEQNHSENKTAVHAEHYYEKRVMSIIPIFKSFFKLRDVLSDLKKINLNSPVTAVMFLNTESL